MGQGERAKGSDSNDGDLHVIPKDLRVDLKEQSLEVIWEEGAKSTYSLNQLRRMCPCATCRTDREEAGRNPLKVLKGDPDGLRVVSAELVGRYAIRFVWSDGHQAGIFNFTMLRGLASP